MIKIFEEFNSNPNIYNFDYDDPEFDHLNRHYIFVGIEKIEDLKSIENLDNFWIGWETLSQKFEFWFSNIDRVDRPSYYIRINKDEGNIADALYFFDREKYIDEFYYEIATKKEWNPHGTMRRVDRELWRHRGCKPHDLEYLEKEASDGDGEAGLMLYHYNIHKNLYK